MTAATGKSHKPVYGTKPEVPDAEDDGVAWSVAGKDEDEARKARIHARGVERAEAKESAAPALRSEVPEQSSVSGGKATAI